MPHTQSAVKTNAKSAKELYSQFVKYYTAKDYAPAIAKLEEAVALYGINGCGISEFEMCLNMGVTYLRNKQTERGEKFIREAVSINPKNPRANYKLGLALARLKKSEEAITYFINAFNLYKSEGCIKEEAEVEARLNQEYERLERFRAQKSR